MSPTRKSRDDTPESSDSPEPQSEPPRRARRWWRRRPTLALLGVVFLTGLLVNPSCVSTVRAPEVVDGDACEVYVVTAALHKALILPGDQPGEWHEYGFGELEWYGRVNDAWYRVFPTMLWPTAGCLGTRTLAATDETQLLARSSGSEIAPLRVARALSNRLRADLDQTFATNAVERFHNSTYRFDFIPESSYWFLNNCHDVTAKWLDQLDCRVSWWPMRFGLRVAE